jgi:hypothetical protein
MESPLWYRVFNEREVKEIMFALHYAELFNHGTSGHMEYTVIAKLAKLLELLHEDAMEDVKHDEEYIKNYLRDVFGGK